MRSSHRHKDKGCLLNGKFETSKRNSVKCKKWIRLAIVKVCMKSWNSHYETVWEALSLLLPFTVSGKKLLLNLYLYFVYCFYDLA